MDQEDFDRTVRLEYCKAGIQSVREVGLIVLQTLVTLNSGAFVVLLTFIGNAAAQSKFMVPLHDLQIAMSLFLFGLLCTFLVLAYTYIVSQSVSPYVGEPRSTDGWYVPISVSVSAVSFLSFLGGVATVVRGVVVT